MKQASKIAAALNIGSTALRMTIAQNSESEYEELEDYEYPLTLGKETFNNEKVNFTTIKSICEMINKYCEIANNLGVPDSAITLTGTTALREAIDREYVLDQIMVKTGNKVKILEDGEEKAYIYRHMIKNISSLKSRSRCYLMAYIGTGSLGVAVVKGGKIYYSQNIRVGTLKLNEIIGNMSQYEDQDLLTAIYEYIDSTFDQLVGRFDKYPINQLYITGKNVNLINHIFGSNNQEINAVGKEKLSQMYTYIKSKSYMEIKNQFNITAEQASMVLPTMILHEKLLNISKSESINYMDITINHAMLFKSLNPIEYKKMKVVFEHSSVMSAQVIAKNYKYDKNHAMSVAQFSLTIFDNLKKVHGFSRRERLYLEVASILHDIGKFVNIKSHNRISADIILDTSIIGLSKREITIIANIARYHSNEVPSNEHHHYQLLNDSDKMIVSKLSAIIRMADALDRSHMQKIDTISMKIVKNKLKIIVNCPENIVLEQWTFQFKSQFFEEVFGLKCQLVNKV